MMDNAMKRHVFLTVAAAASIATAQAPRVRDSAGVRIVENGRRLTAPAVFQLADKPSFDVGGLQQDPADEFDTHNYYLQAVRLSDGRVVVIDKSRVHFFDATGKRLRIVGRSGEGPGEYMQATDICITRGDTILVGQTRRAVTKLTEAGDFVTMMAIAPNTYTEGQFCFDDGSFATLHRGAGAPAGPRKQQFDRVTADGVITPLAEWELTPFDMLVTVEDRKAVHGDRLYLAKGQSFEIGVYSRDGRMVSAIRTSDGLVPIPAAEKAKMPAPYRMGSSPAEIEVQRQKAIAGSTTKYWPTFGPIIMGSDGRLWVADWDSGRDPLKPTFWTAFDSTGRLLGRLAIPGWPSKERRQRVVAFGKNEVFLNRADDDGALHITAYPILPVRK
jgi:hypothetical protein